MSVDVDGVADQSRAADHVDRIDHLIGNGGQRGGSVACLERGADRVYRVDDIGLAEAAYVSVDNGIGDQVPASPRGLRYRVTDTGMTLA